MKLSSTKTRSKELDAFEELAILVNLFRWGFFLLFKDKKYTGGCRGTLGTHSHRPKISRFPAFFEKISQNLTLVPPHGESVPAMENPVFTPVIVSILSGQWSFPILHKVGNIDISILHKFENKLDREVSHFNYSTVDCFQFISIRSWAKMPTLPTLCVSGKLE